MSQANPTRTTGFASLSSARLTDGRQQLFGVGTDGNIYRIWEPGFAAFSSNWIRAYK